MTPGAFRVPDGITPIEAFRAWVYEFDGGRGRLYPLTGGAVGAFTPWHEAGWTWVVASCPRARAQELLDHEVPSADCTCGLYAVKDLSLVPWVPEWGPTVLGRVQLAGTVIEHELGFRGGQARIVELLPWLGHETDARRLALSLGVGIGRPVAAPSPDPEPSDPRRPLASWTSTRLRAHLARRAARRAA